MQAPPPPLQGPKYEPSVGTSVDPSLDESPPELPRQHLKSFPPGHLPLTLSPLH